MSIRLDPRRLGTLKQLAGDAGMRPGDLVRQWVEERIDAARQGIAEPAAARGLSERVDQLTQRVAALEAATQVAPATADTAPVYPAEAEDQDAQPAPATEEDEQSQPAMAEKAGAEAGEEATPKARRKRISAAPSGERVALHDEMIAVLSERGAMTAGELAAAIVERGRYAPPRSGKPLDAAMVSQRVSNPTYRSRFTRNEGRIGLAEDAPV